MADRREVVFISIFSSCCLLLILATPWAVSRAACEVQTPEFSINWVSVDPLPPIKWNISLSVHNPNHNHIISNLRLTIWVLAKGNFLAEAGVKPFVLEPQNNQTYVIDNVQIVAPPTLELEAVVDKERNRNGTVSFQVIIQSQMTLTVLSSGSCQTYYPERKSTVSCGALKVQFNSVADRGIFSGPGAIRCADWH